VDVGVGGSGHHIISQGEADRVLYTSPKDRKNMIEDALGLRIYHIKQQEAERKLVSTAENMREVGMLRREIQPHMRFLAGEAKKIESSQKMREELVGLLGVYMNRETASLETLRRTFEEHEEPLKNELKEAEQLATALQNSLTKKQSLAVSSTPKDVEEAIRRLRVLDVNRPEIEREIGRVEGQLVVWGRKEAQPKGMRAWSAQEVETEMQSIISSIDIAIAFKTIETIHAKLSELKERITRFLTGGHKVNVVLDISQERRELEQMQEALQQQLQEHEEERKQLLEIKNKWDDLRRDSQKGFWEEQKLLRVGEERVYAAKDGLRSLELERERLRARVDEFNLEQTLAESFLESVIIEHAEPWSQDERLKEYQKIQRLRMKLEEAGGVNPHILQEYQEVQQRDVFLAKELDDLQKTEKSLVSLQEQLDTDLQQSFSEGIKKINTKFDELFQAMFGGGSAKLTLVKLQSREEHELGGPTAKLSEEVGVDITVDIPRKRVKNLDMLSGGERALTSIALLFAMSFVNPPPFLILDETDAALDEANSQRYGAMLKNLSDKTQLIVITHNRQTMKEAGVLYGVTMGSDGVSRLLSLKFEEATEVSKT